MLTDPLILFVIATNALALSALHPTGYDVFLPDFVAIPPLHHQKVGLMANIVTICLIAGAFAKGKKVDGVQHVGFAHPVGADETIDIGREAQFGLLNVLIIENGKLL